MRQRWAVVVSMLLVVSGCGIHSLCNRAIFRPTAILTPLWWQARASARSPRSGTRVF
jgi:hypothetical protein